MIEMDTLTLVRWRLAEGRTIADSDVHKLVAQIEQLKDELSEAIERGDDWCDQAKKARAERDRMKGELRDLHASATHAYKYRPTDTPSGFKNAMSDLAETMERARTALKESGQ
jgi:hypothetical protein